MRIRLLFQAAAPVAAITVFIMLLAFQAPTAGQQPAAPPAPAAGGQRGGAPAVPGAQGGVVAPAPGRGRAGGPRIPDGALRPEDPHPAALPVDLFTTKNFYKDRALWSDPKYFRCNSSFAIEQQHHDSEVAVATIKGSPSTAAWGYCDRDYPREAIVSPYRFKSAEEHYEAL